MKFFIVNSSRTLAISICETALVPGQLFPSVHMEKNYLERAGLHGIQHLEISELATFTPIVLTSHLFSHQLSFRKSNAQLIQGLGHH